MQKSHRKRPKEDKQTNYRISKNKFGQEIHIPIVHVTNGLHERDRAEKMIKAANGQNSQYIPNRNQSPY